MKRQNVTSSGWWVSATRLMVLFCALFVSTHCLAEDVAVLIGQSPPNGGEVAGGTGVRYYPSGSMIRLLAIPRPGFQFVYWLGDVVDPLLISTVVHIDGPKIIIAVYAKLPEDEPLESASPQIGVAAGSAETGVRAAEPKPSPPHPPPPPPPPAEPSTIFLFGLAAVILRRRYRRS